MKYIISILFFVFIGCVVATAKTPARIVAETEEEILSDDSNMRGTKTIIDTGINWAIERGALELEKKGYAQDAQTIRNEWSMLYAKTLFLYDNRDIGDHPGIFQWVEDTYRRIELLLGHDLCVSSHIDLMLTFNNGAPVAVHPCTFKMDGVPGLPIDEYRRNIAGKSVVSDSRYEGVIPGAVFVACEIACMAGTSGIGSVVCGMAAGIGEKLMATYVAPRLADRIFNKRCNGKEMGDY